MRILSAFFLALFIYVGIIGYFLYFIISKNQKSKPEIVYIHQVIQIPKQKIKKTIKQKKVIEKKIPKAIIKKEISKIKEIKTKSTFSKGGENINIDDIFSNISDNIKTEKVKYKKTKNMTKKIGDTISNDVKEKISKLKSTKKAEFLVSNVDGLKSQVDYLQKEFYKKWMEMNVFEPNKEVDIQVNIDNGNMEIYIIATNLDTIRLNEFMKSLKRVKVKKIKNLEAKFIFKSKLKE